MSEIVTSDYINQLALNMDSYNKACKNIEEIGNRLLDNLDYVNIQPKSILDLGCKDGSLTKILAKKYPDAQIIGFDYFEELVQTASKNNNASNITYCFNDDIYNELKHKKFDLVFSNCTLPYLNLDKIFLTVYKILNKNGLFLFSSFGPNTLKEIRRQEDAALISNFIDMHYLGDILVKYRFAEPVIHSENILFKYKDKDKLYYDLNNCILPIKSNKKIDTNEKVKQNPHSNDNLYNLNIEAIYAHCWMPKNKIEILEKI